MSVELKVKHKSLTSEAKIIKKEEQKKLAYSRYARRTNSVDPNPSFREFLSLQQHRKGPVREEARITHLARAYIKGQKYKEVEQPKQKLPAYMVTRLHRLLTRYSCLVEYGTILDWTRT